MERYECVKQRRSTWVACGPPRGRDGQQNCQLDSLHFTQCPCARSLVQLDLQTRCASILYWLRRTVPWTPSRPSGTWMNPNPCARTGPAIHVAVASKPLRLQYCSLSCKCVSYKPCTGTSGWSNSGPRVQHPEGPSPGSRLCGTNRHWWQGYKRGKTRMREGRKAIRFKPFGAVASNTSTLQYS